MPRTELTNTISSLGLTYNELGKFEASVLGAVSPQAAFMIGLDRSIENFSSGHYFYTLRTDAKQSLIKLFLKADVFKKDGRAEYLLKGLDDKQVDKLSSEECILVFERLRALDPRVESYVKGLGKIRHHGNLGQGLLIDMWNKETGVGIEKTLRNFSNENLQHFLIGESNPTLEGELFTQLRAIYPNVGLISEKVTYYLNINPESSDFHANIERGRLYDLVEGVHRMGLQELPFMYRLEALMVKYRGKGEVLLDILKENPLKDVRMNLMENAKKNRVIIGNATPENMKTLKIVDEKFGVNRPNRPTYHSISRQFEALGKTIQKDIVSSSRFNAIKARFTNNKGILIVVAIIVVLALIAILITFFLGKLG